MGFVLSGDGNSLTNSEAGGYSVSFTKFTTNGSLYCPRTTWVLSIVLHLGTDAEIYMGSTAGVDDLYPQTPLLAGANIINLQTYFTANGRIYITADRTVNISAAYASCAIGLPLP